ncbi:hypothetical protein VTL71DRAFT_10532 [Oculimacula yallundae]|uniref:Uncharacterized protein n=1 Tax=Oculimacula yallundae TaxID=86028 RepID=A0ABR4CV04_9HELO
MCYTQWSSFPSIDAAKGFLTKAFITDRAVSRTQGALEWPESTHNGSCCLDCYTVSKAVDHRYGQAGLQWPNIFTSAAHVMDAGEVLLPMEAEWGD